MALIMIEKKLLTAMLEGIERNLLWIGWYLTLVTNEICLNKIFVKNNFSSSQDVVVFHCDSLWKWKKKLDFIDKKWGSIWKCVN